MSRRVKIAGASRPQRTRQSKKLAVLSIGINYLGQHGQLGGCVNDSNNVLKFIKQRRGRDLVYLKQMVDTLPTSSNLYPTKSNIEHAIESMVNVINQQGINDVLLHYSGHGTQVMDTSGDEMDGMDEALVPVDHANSGCILDDWLRDQFVAKLPKGCNTMCIVDACHSKTMMDLKYEMAPQGTMKDVRPNLSEVNASLVLLSGCQDHKVSYDIYDRQFGASGAMTASLLKLLQRNRNLPASKIIKQLRSELIRKGYPQIPQISSTRRLGPNAKFPII